MALMIIEAITADSVALTNRATGLPVASINWVLKVTQ
jgi:hypothetical protein